MAELPANSLAARPTTGSLPADSQSRPGLAPVAPLPLACPGGEAVPASVMARVQGEGMPQGQMDRVLEKQSNRNTPVVWRMAGLPECSATDPEPSDREAGLIKSCADAGKHCHLPLGK